MRRMTLSASIPAKAPKAVPAKPKPERVPVVAIAWPPERPDGFWRIEVRADRERVAAKIVIPPIGGLEDPAAEVLGELWIKHRLPPTWRDLLWPSAVVADELLIPWRPSDVWNRQIELSTLKGVLSLCPI
ncbi:MAG: hypothetical protein GYA33_16325 [Thermogutta sp.]|nr:hypothetical protein [Thermogutta sp.]